MTVVDIAALAKVMLRAAEGVDYSKRYAVTSAIYRAGLLGGQSAFALGLVLPAIGAAVTWSRRRRERSARARYSGQIEPLWRGLTDAFPAVVLPSSVQAHTRGGGDHADFARTAQEITDGLAQLAPFYLASGLSPDQVETGVREPDVAARIIRAALDNRRRGEGRAGPPFPRWNLIILVGASGRGGWCAPRGRFNAGASPGPLPLSR